MTDVQLEEDLDSYGRVEIGAYVSSGSQFIDVIVLSDRESAVQIPMAKVKENVQMILKFMDKTEKKIGSVSIPAKMFLELNIGEQFGHWVTLFDYLEDDEYDGDLGVDDEEAPRIFISYYLDPNPVRKKAAKQSTKTTTTREETKSGGRVVTNTKTVTTTSYNSRYSPTKLETVQRTYASAVSNPAPENTRIVTNTKTVAQSQPQPKPKPKVQHIEPISESYSNGRDDFEKYSVRTLQEDLYTHLGQVKESLNKQQDELFDEEDRRVKTLSQLENLHKELQGEHVQDQITGFQLNRLDQTVTNDYDVVKDRFGREQDAISSTIDDINNAKSIVDRQHKIANTEYVKVSQEASRIENIRTRGLNSASQQLRDENKELRKNIRNTNSDLAKESDEINRLKRRHDDIIHSYNTTIDRYNDMLSKVEDARRQAQDQSDTLRGDISNEDYSTIVLSKGMSHTTDAISSLSATSKLLNGQLKNLESKYQTFIKDLSKINDGQESKAEELRRLFNEKQSDIRTLNDLLYQQSSTITGLNTEVDKANAEALNKRVRQLIDTLIEIDSKRKTSQEELESSQTGWSMKLKLFQDEASRRSREAAIEKRAHEIDTHIKKIDGLTREINDLYDQYDALQARIFTDGHRDLVADSLLKEQEGLKLKIRWAEEERRTTLSELDALLKIMKQQDIRDQQQSDIQALTEELAILQTELQSKLTIIKELNDDINSADQEIAGLEDEIAQLDAKIEEIQKAIEEKNREIDELNRLVEERNVRIYKIEKDLGKATQRYKAAKGDAVDQMLADYLNIAGSEVPIKRLGGGFYLFGTRKIFAKIMNGKLVVRVGGGYMVIEEFIATYTESEINKLNKICQREGVDSFYDLDLEFITGYGGDRSPGMRSPGGKALGSPKNRSFRGAAGNSTMNGSKRAPKFNATQLANARKF